MKKRLKGLLVLWLAFLMVVSMPMTANAVDQYGVVTNVYLYQGKEALRAGYGYKSDNNYNALFKNQYSEDNNDSPSDVTATYKVDASLSNILSKQLEKFTGYSMIGWRLWNSTSGYYLSNPSDTVSTDYTITSSDYNKYVKPNDTNIDYMVIEPVWELDYKITAQPTNANPRVGLNEEGEAAGPSYQWYSIQTSPAQATDWNNPDSTISYNSQTGNAVVNEKLNLTLSEVSNGDILRLTYSTSSTLELVPFIIIDGKMSYPDGIIESVPNTDNDYKILMNGTIGLGFWGTGEVKIEVIHEELVTSVTGSDFSGDNGYYYCEVTFLNGAKLISDRFTYTRYDITDITASTANGKCSFLVGGNAATKAAPESDVTVVVEPEIGYELSKLTVKEADTYNEDGIKVTGKTTDITETRTFTMPEKSVEVEAVFVPKKYEVTLPTATVGYTVNPVPVEDVQKTSVEHGGSYEFYVSIQNGYVATNDYAVKANDTTLTATSSAENVYIYTITNVTQAQTITVTGVNELHPITTLGKSTEGNYTVTAGEGSDVPVAAKGTILTITPTPAEGYELDTITVIQKDGSDTAVTVDAKNQFTMPDYPVEVSVTFKKKTYGITLPQNQIGYTVKSSQTSPVEYGSDYTFKVTVGEGYDVPIALVVKTNGTALEATSVTGKEYTYTIKNVAAAQEITVGGVSDTTAPALTITLDEANFWEKFLPKIVFNLFFKEDKSLTITSTDAGSGIRSVMYYVSETDLFPNEGVYTSQDIENKISQWTEYTTAVSISGDNSYVVYAKATDVVGNVTYVSTSGIVIDATAPVISGLEDGGPYYGDTAATISDANLSTVKLDGKAVEFTEIPVSITITADGADHTIEAVDKAGNQTSYKVTVSETWVRDGISTAGSRVLKLGVPYKFGSGKWKVAGDTTVYEGGNTFYASEGGTFDFQSQ